MMSNGNASVSGDKSSAGQLYEYPYLNNANNSLHNSKDHSSGSGSGRD
jgi:hypothetical protein